MPLLPTVVLPALWPVLGQRHLQRGPLAMAAVLLSVGIGLTVQRLRGPVPPAAPPAGSG